MHFIDYRQGDWDNLKTLMSLLRQGSHKIKITPKSQNFASETALMHVKKNHYTVKKRQYLLLKEKYEAFTIF